MTMVRTILAVLIAVGVSTAPVNSGPAVSMTPAKMSMAGHVDMPCCPPPDDGKGTAACAFKCLNFVAALFPAAVAVSEIGRGLPVFFADDTLDGSVRPPTHPPPI